MGFAATQIFFRGTTIFWTTTFYDQNGAVVQPASATINLVYPDGAQCGTDTTTVAMTAPTAPAVTWSAQWDSRNAGPGAVSWSIHTASGPPNAVEDGAFTLTANPANLVTF